MLEGFIGVNFSFGICGLHWNRRLGNDFCKKVFVFLRSEAADIGVCFSFISFR